MVLLGLATALDCTALAAAELMRKYLRSTEFFS
jgi:hypothetical protein